jgi:hypothetical protein
MRTVAAHFQISLALVPGDGASFPMSQAGFQRGFSARADASPANRSQEGRTAWTPPKETSA